MSQFLVLYYIFGVFVGAYGYGLNRTARDACSPTAGLPEPKSGCCGVEATEATTGTNIYYSPWAALIEYGNGKDTSLPCGGTLISGRYLLTTAHCFGSPTLESMKPVNVILGKYNIKTDGPDCDDISKTCTDGGISIPIDTIITHPDYNGRKKQNDIALVKLARNAPYTKFIRPICLPSTDISENPSDSLIFNVAGWYNDFMTEERNVKRRDVDVKYVDRNVCKDVIGSISKRFEITDAHICGSNTCRGESGAAVALKRQNYYEVTGLVSYGLRRRCEVTSIPDIFTNVFKYIDWIKSVVE